MRNEMYFPRTPFTAYTCTVRVLHTWCDVCMCCFTIAGWCCYFCVDYIDTGEICEHFKYKLNDLFASQLVGVYGRAIKDVSLKLCTLLLCCAVNQLVPNSNRQIQNDLNLMCRFGNHFSNVLFFMFLFVFKIEFYAWKMNKQSNLIYLKKKRKTKTKMILFIYLKGCVFRWYV